MLSGLLDLADLTVSEVMVHRTKMRTINADLSSEEIVREVLSSPYTRLPLWRGSQENIVGVLPPRTCCALDAVGGDASELRVEAIALETWFVPDTMSLRDQLKAFLAKKTHFALVVDEYGEVMESGDPRGHPRRDRRRHRDRARRLRSRACGRSRTARSTWTARCRSATSTAPWTGTFRTRKPPPSPAS